MAPCAANSLVLAPRTSEHGTHAQVVAFVARELEEVVAWILLERERDGPWFGPRLRIVNGDFIAERVLVGSREALRHARRLRKRAIDAAVLVEVGRLDHQCLPLPRPS